LRNEWQTEKERLEMSRPKQRGQRAQNIAIAIIVLAAIAAGIYLTRAKLGQLWLQVTGKAPSQVEETVPDDEPMIPGKDF
jgi:predicted membrane-bound mannosyltransferase